MTNEEINQKFDDIIQPKVIQQVIKERRPPAKFPELRWIAGVTFIGSFGFMIICASIATLLESMQDEHPFNFLAGNFDIKRVLLYIELPSVVDTEI